MMAVRIFILNLSDFWPFLDGGACFLVRVLANSVLFAPFGTDLMVLALVLGTVAPSPALRFTPPRTSFLLLL